MSPSNENVEGSPIASATAPIAGETPGPSSVPVDQANPAVPAVENRTEEDLDGADIPIDFGDEDDGDSALGDDTNSSTTSLKDHVTNYPVLYGRTYHNFNESGYWGPNDEKMSDQLDIGHQMFNIMLDGKLYLAPLPKDVHTVLDVGTGTGIWAIDFADTHPSADVVGIDISPIQPSFVPPNCRFELDDAQLEWTYPANHFDFIHVRALHGGISDWPSLYSEAFKCTKPGGYVEQVEIDIMLRSDDGSVDSTHFMHRWSATLLEASERTGKSLASFETMTEGIKTAGFEGVEERIFKVPVGAWSSDPRLKIVGRWAQLFCLEGADSWALYLLSQVMKWDYVEIQVFIATMKKELVDRRNHAYFRVKVVTGRKPRGVTEPAPAVISDTSEAPVATTTTE